MVSLDRFRRYDVQASWACLLALVSVPPGLAATVLLLRNYHHELGQIIYGAKGLFLPAFVCAALLSMACGAAALLLGWNSAGQRRNDKPGRSWTGFFLGGAMLTWDLILIIAFVMLRLQKPM